MRCSGEAGGNQAEHLTIGCRGCGADHAFGQPQALRAGPTPLTVVSAKRGRVPAAPTLTLREHAFVAAGSTSAAVARIDAATFWTPGLTRNSTRPADCRAIRLGRWPAAGEAVHCF